MTDAMQLYNYEVNGQKDIQPQAQSGKKLHRTQRLKNLQRSLKFPTIMRPNDERLQEQTQNNGLGEMVFKIDNSNFASKVE